HHLLERARQDLDRHTIALHAVGERTLGQTRTQLHQLEHRLASLHPRAQLLHRRAQLAELEGRLAGVHPRSRVARARLDHSALVARGAVAVRARLEASRAQLARIGAQLAALSPLAVLDRGYSMVSKGGEIVRDASQVSPGDRIGIRLARGALEVSVD